jgi:hypothetical protein
MSELEVINQVLERTARRRRLNRALTGLWRGGFVGASIWLLTLVIYKVLPVPPVALIVGGIVGLLAIIAGLFAGGWRSNSIIDTARWVDRSRKLDERVSTAIEFASGSREETWKQLLLADAAKSVGKLDPRQMLPLHMPRAGRWALVLLMLSAGLGFVPEYRSKSYVQKKKDEEVIKQTGRELAQLTRRSLDTRKPSLEPTQKSLEAVTELGDHLAKAQLTKSQALHDLANVTEKLKQETKDLAKNPALKTMERAVRSSSKGATASSPELQKQMDALQKQLGNGSPNPDALEKMKEDIQKARDAAKQMADKDGAASDAAKDKMNQALADLAKQAKEMGLSLPSLSEAIASLAKSQVDQVVKDLQVAEIDLEKMESMAKAIEKMQLQAEQLGKDLAEQLKNGQAEAAQATLRKMSQELQASKLSPEQMEKMMKDVANAISPGKEYGKVGDLLKDAAGKMQAGQKAPAGQSLAAAAKELDKMMGELGDAQALISALEALQQAQMAIGSGQCFGLSPGKPAWSRGKGVGKSGGFGTWTDENSWVYPEFADRWDNTGVVRPDMDAKGLTDRGDGGLADNLAPTKIKGQMTPGGPMPSITLKGVSIKGTSKVNFKEVAAAAQSDAQSALSQEQVPRAYQGAVRDYFNDLKE